MIVIMEKIRLYVCLCLGTLLSLVSCTHLVCFGSFPSLPFLSLAFLSSRWTEPKHKHARGKPNERGRKGRDGRDGRKEEWLSVIFTQ